MTNSRNEEVFHYPMPRTCPFQPPPQYQALREEEPVARVVLPTGNHAWVLTRYEHIRAVLIDPRFSSARTNPGFPVMEVGQRTLSDYAPSLDAMDPPEHTEARRAVVGEFTVKRLRTLRPRIQQIVDECLDDIVAGSRPVDLVQTLSLPVPSLVTCELLGVPYADHDLFQKNMTRMVSRSSSPEEVVRAVAELRSYLGELVAAKEADPSDDLLGQQIVKHRENGTFDHEAMVSLAFLLLGAGHETTANMISLGTVALLENPRQLAMLRQDPGKTPAAVDELLRIFTIGEVATKRVALSDVEIGGVLIRAGEGVIGLGNAANHDPRVFENPDELNIERDARHHLAFGYGAHQCLGQNLARLELQIVFDALFKRIPNLRLAKPVSDLPFKDNANIYGLFELPVTW